MNNIGDNCVQIIGEHTVFIDDTVKIGKNVTIYQNNIIKGNTVIGDNVTLLPSNYIVDSVIENHATIEFSYIEDSVVGESTHIGPYSRLRPKSKIGKNCKIGNFVEIKNSNIGNGTKASHLAYVGDADVGENCNLGCGVVFVNYNGKSKARSVIGNNCFIGSNVNVVAPVNVKDGGYVCAGTTLTVDTDVDDFVIGRCRETIKTGYASKYKKGDK